MADVALSTQFATETLIGGLDATLYAVGSDDLRPQMKGVYMDFTNCDGKVVFVATDTHKLAKCEKALTEPINGEPSSCILPTSAVNIVRSLFAKEPTLQMRLSDKHAEFENTSAKFSTVLIKGRFPDYKRVIPQNPSHVVKADRAGLREAINRVYGFAGVNNMIALRFGSGVVDIDAKDAENMQNASEQVVCESDANITIGFSAEYLMAILNSLTAEQVKIGLFDASRPAVFSNADDESASEIGLLMPMNLG